jgi:hypothetical protein
MHRLDVEVTRAGSTARMGTTGANLLGGVIGSNLAGMSPTRTFAVLVLTLLAGCPDSSHRSRGGGDAPAPIAAPATARPGYLTGSVLDERGQPIGERGRVSVWVDGISAQSGETIHLSPPVRPDGTYEARLVDGIYHPVRASVEVTFEGSTYRFDLDPVQDDTSDRESGPGIVQDFVWKLTGPRAGYRANPDPSNHTHWYGCSARVRLTGWRDDLNRAVERPPEGTRYVFTLAPQGTLIDGSQARALTFERAYTGGELDNGNLHDIPLGTYSMTGVEVAPDGARRPLVFQVEHARYEPTAKVAFPASEVLHGPHIPAFDFDRQ